MAPRPLIVRWRKDKIRRKKEAPKAFASKASGGLSKNAVRENAAFQYNKRGGAGSHDYQRLQHYINTRKPHQRILFWLFSTKFRDVDERTYQQGEFDSHTETYQVLLGETIEQARERAKNAYENSMHPKMAVELLEARYIAQDPSLKVFEFDGVCVEQSPFHEIWMYFRGSECFIIYRKEREVLQSRMYRDPMWLKKFAFKSIRKVEWAGEPKIIPEDISLLTYDTQSTHLD